MTLYGEQIGKKFEPDGSPRWYPGNTVIAVVTAGSSGYAAMTRVREMALASGIGDTLILLPEDSYHMTVLRGLNDQVRTDAFRLQQVLNNLLSNAFKYSNPGASVRLAHTAAPTPSTAPASSVSPARKPFFQLHTAA